MWYITGMKKLTLIIALILLSGCAAGRQETAINYIAPKEVESRARLASVNAQKCFNFSEDNKPTAFLISPSKAPNAWVNDDNNVILTEGLFSYDDTLLTLIVYHELSHIKLNHIRNRRLVSYATTGIMTAVGFIIPYSGYLNYAVNPAVTNNFSKSQEYDADRLASETLVKCLGIPIDQQIKSFEPFLKTGRDGGGFWSTHPSAVDRIANINNLKLPSTAPEHNP
jgi:Zn-dependent protease with chaperone function